MERPRKPRISVVATLAPSASTVYSIAASLPALAVFVAASQAPLAATQVAAFISLATPLQAPSAATQSSLLLHPSEAPSGEAPSSSTPSAGAKGGAAQPPGGPPSEPDDNSDKRKRDKQIDIKRKDKFLIDNTALKSAKSRFRENMKCEV